MSSTQHIITCCSLYWLIQKRVKPLISEIWDAAAKTKGNSDVTLSTTVTAAMLEVYCVAVA